MCNAVGVQSGRCAMPVVSKGEAMSVQGVFSARLGVQAVCNAVGVQGGYGRARGVQGTYGCAMQAVFERKAMQ